MRFFITCRHLVKSSGGMLPLGDDMVVPAMVPYVLAAAEMVLRDPGVTER